MRRRLLDLAMLFALVGCSSGIATTGGVGGAQIPIEVLRPEGAGPFPAVVVLHACNGIGGIVTHQWAKRLVEQGYVVALPDSFTTRGYPKGVCGFGTEVSADVRKGDAYMALHLLEVRSDVQPERIGLIGFSHGGWTVVATMDRSGGAGKPTIAQHDFAAAVALYPRCDARYGSFVTYVPAASLLILAGELDDWTPSAPCNALAQRSAAAGHPIAIKIYPGAMHAFDSYAPLTVIPQANRGRGAHVAGNAEARADAIKQVSAFFGKWLKE